MAIAIEQRATPRSLAILGGEPAFAEPLHVGRPNIGRRQELFDYLNLILDNRWLTNNGPLLVEFEARLRALLGVKHCMAVCNATVGLEIAARALGLDGEVIVPSFTFVATAHALQWLGITPVFADVDPDTHTLDPASVEALITPRTTGILGVHLWGRPCDIAGLQAVAEAHGLRLYFDAAHALACSYNGRMIGNYGNLEVFSLHATKFANAFEGGVIATNDDELAAQVRLMRNFGFSGYDQVDSVGINGKMNEISAAMGLVSLNAMDEFVAVNRRNHAWYRQALAGLPGIKLAQYDEQERRNYQYVVVEVDEALAGLSRDALVEVLWAERVLARRYFYPSCHRMEPYCTLDPETNERLPHTNRLSAQVMALPTGTAMGRNEIETVGSILSAALAQAAKVKQARSQRDTAS